MPFAFADSTKRLLFVWYMPATPSVANRYHRNQGGGGGGGGAVVRPMLFLKKKTLLRKKEPSKNFSPILGVGASKSLLRPLEGFSSFLEGEKDLECRRRSWVLWAIESRPTQGSARKSTAKSKKVSIFKTRLFWEIAVGVEIRLVTGSLNSCVIICSVLIGMPRNSRGVWYTHSNAFVSKRPFNPKED